MRSLQKLVIFRLFGGDSVWRLVETRYQGQSVVPPPCAFPASILLILRIGTGTVQGGTQKTRLGAGFSIGNWVLFIDFGRGMLIVSSIGDRRYEIGLLIDRWRGMLICRRSEIAATRSGF